MDISTACNSKVETGFGKPSRHGVPCAAMDDCVNPTPCSWFWRLVLKFIEHIPLCNNFIEEKKISHQLKHNLHSLLEALATCFGLIKPSSCPVQCNDLSTQVLLLYFFCGIPHHTYHYNKIIIVKDPLLKLTIFRNIIGNIEKMDTLKMLKSKAEA